MSAKHKAHLASFRSNFELMCLFAVLVITADMAWVIRDMIANNYEVFYFFLLGTLGIGNVGTIYILWTHHAKLVRKVRRTIMMDKLRYNRWLKKHRG
jgi:hypothetical protein